MSSQHARRPIVVTHESGLCFAAQVGAHRLIVDQPLRSGGDDRGPAPIELLGAALGTCIALYVQQFCHSRGLDHEGFRVEVEQHGASNPSRVDRFVVRVVLMNELPQQYAAILERVVRSCPAHNTLTSGAAVEVTIDKAAGARAVSEIR
jgi:putative redox protein